MKYASYNAFRASVQQMFDGDDISISDISVNVLDTIIAAGEERIYREVRSSTLDAPFTLTVGSYSNNLLLGTMTAATFTSGAIGYNSVFGALSTPVDTLGSTVTAIAEAANAQPFTLQLRGASSNDLGKTYFTTISVVGGSINTTLNSSNAVYSYSSGISQWLFTGQTLGLTAGTSYVITIVLTVAGTTNSANLPDDFVEMRQGPYVAGYVQAIYVPPEAFQNISALAPRTTTHPTRYTIFDDTIQFYPALADGSVVTGRYYRQFTEIGIGGLNDFFNRWPDLFLYAALAESAPFLGEMTRLPIWESKYKDIAQSVNETERRRATRGSKLQTRLA